MYCLFAETSFGFSFTSLTLVFRYLTEWLKTYIIIISMVIIT